ncbi:MAG: queuosine precursor transporter [Lachnospiraceae bacterium]|nr:queuosine precursor transporter [Lachnospiraceae bacterium]MDD3615510.1 queuosine precursor transporter [Lachnospiraceae bacterium]
MQNELLLIGSVFVIFLGTLLFYYFFGKTGLYCWTVLGTIAANIEVLIMIDAFGMEQTLGNVLFASTFLVTDILSEVYGKEASKKAVNIGIMASLMFIILSQYWLQYTPGQSDWAMPSMQTIFSNTPRLMLASLVVYAICQRFDVWAYHKWWAFTEKKFGSHDKYLWLRNNGSTLISQLLNTFLYTFAAFAGLYSFPVLMSIVGSSYVIFIVTSLADTPVIYLARKIKPRSE